MYTFGPLIAKNSRSGRLLGGAPVTVTTLAGATLSTVPAPLVTNHEGYLPAFTADTDQRVILARPRGGDPLPLYAHEGIQDAAEAADTINTGRLSEDALKGTFATLDYLDQRFGPDPFEPPEVYVHDTFNRPDSGTLGSPDIGVAQWVPSSQGDQFGILDGKAYQPGTGNTLHSVINTGHPDGVLTVDLTAGNTLGVMVRFIDSQNYMRVMVAPTAVLLEKRDNGSFTTLTSTPFAATAGQTYTLEVRLDGPLITVTLAGLPQFDHTLTGADQAKYGTVTNFGLAQSSHNTIHRWDNFKFTALPIDPDPDPDPSPIDLDLLLRTWASAGSYAVTGNIVRDSFGVVTAADITWPDDSPGAFTATTTAAGYIDAYTITHTESGRQARQPAVTRNTYGDITTQPALVVEETP